MPWSVPGPRQGCVRRARYLGALQRLRPVVGDIFTRAIDIPLGGLRLLVGLDAVHNVLLTILHPSIS